jgi:hypothetical protein
MMKAGLWLSRAGIPVITSLVALFVTTLHAD